MTIKTDIDVEMRYRDKALETRLAFWSALLTVNGVIVSAFSILSLVIKRLDCILTIFVGACLFAALVSLYLLLLNFEAAKKVYELIGKVISVNNDSLTDEVRNKNIDNARKLNKKIGYREVTVKWLFAVQLLLLLSIFLIQLFFGP